MNTNTAKKTTHPYKILCYNLPAELLEKNLLREHFDQFGTVEKIHFRPKHNVWMVQYDTKESASNAILNGGNYNGHVFDVCWDYKKRKIKNDDPDWAPDPEVLKELEAMGSLGDRIFKRNLNLRPEGMVVDSPTSTKSIQSPKTKLKTVAKSKMDPRLRKSLTKKTVSEKMNWTVEQIGLLSILKQPALTLEEKYRVLDARDKLMRLRMKRSQDMTKTDHLVGTCPDMCPEKERLMRETQHQVALYEQDVGGRGMNPVLAVKQYSRSSADQEVPLPHELRPVAVLQLTMEYLMHHIMNLCDFPDVNIAEWYHFLWDRTRGIRKDITQQALCCQGSVILVEQCARFHIHCSARLVAEDVSVFDHKINTENLTKCLQTLKYMYHDLHVKNESCPNEAEFRAYIILLNLNDGNFMWEVQQLKQEIQKSPEVRFAIEVYSALDKNNYIKFFKLVHLTTYLNACILLRYFVQVRTKALVTLVRCYAPRASYTQFSLAELQVLLAFEDMESTKEFVLSFGLHLNQNNSHIILNKENFVAPLVPNSLDRAITVVESKRQKSVGEIVCGSSIASSLFDKYTPFDSFSEDGIFNIPDTLKILIEEEQPKVEQFEPIVTKESVVDTPKSGDFVKPFWSVKSDTNTNANNIFNPKTEASQLSIFGTLTGKESNTSTSKAEFPNIFGNSKQKESEFSFKYPSVTNQPSTSIFSKSLFTNTVKPTSTEGIFGSFPKENDVQKQFSFGSIPLAQHMNIFESSPNTLISESKLEILIQQQNAKDEENRQKLHELELEKQKQLESKRLELERQAELEAKKRQLELERQHQLQLEKQKLIEYERQKQIELENQKRLAIKRQLELEKEKKTKKLNMNNNYVLKISWNLRKKEWKRKRENIKKCYYFRKKKKRNVD